MITTAHVYLTRAQKKLKRRYARLEARAGVKPPEHAPGLGLGTVRGRTGKWRSGRLNTLALGVGGLAALCLEGVGVCLSICWPGLDGL